jgi:hypothetical protein
MEQSEHLWARRLRWRLRGAWQWPAYAVLTLLDALILHELPPVNAEIDLLLGLIVASFVNLFLMGAVAPWLARRLAARERAAGGNGVPLSVRIEVLKDRTAAVLLGVASVGLVAAGLAARPLIISETEDTERNAELVRDYVLAEAPHEIQRNVDTANTVKLEDGYFRTCVNYDQRDRAYCLFVDVDAEPPTVKRDPSTLPNQEFKPR